VVWNPGASYLPCSRRPVGSWNTGLLASIGLGADLVALPNRSFTEDLEKAEKDSPDRALLAAQLVVSAMEASVAWHRRWPVPVTQPLGAVTP
jgi:hypothetical protein